MADAVCASVGNAHDFKNGRQFAAWVGYHKTLIAIANKSARQLWALLAKGETYNLDAWQQYANGELS